MKKQIQNTENVISYLVSEDKESYLMIQGSKTEIVSFTKGFPSIRQYDLKVSHEIPFVKSHPCTQAEYQEMKAKAQYTISVTKLVFAA